MTLGSETQDLICRTRSRFGDVRSVALADLSLAFILRVDFLVHIPSVFSVFRSCFVPIPAANSANPMSVRLSPSAAGSRANAITVVPCSSICVIVTG